MRPLLRLRQLLLPAGLLLGLAGCVDPYMPDAIGTTPPMLVVDGFINTNGISQVRLSYTYNLSATEAPAETGATVYIEEENGPQYPLRETAGGRYASAALVLDASHHYRLRLSTARGQQYASDYVAAHDTPPIDSLSWEAATDELRVKVNTHDPQNATHYYRWEYEETWEIAPVVFSYLEYINHAVVPRVTTYPNRCWRTAVSSDINTAQTTALTQDVVASHVVRKIPNNTELLFYKYSILVRQHSMGAEENAYWSLLKKNTENIGTLFDPLPSQLTGNVHNLNNADELVLGFVGAHSVTEKRLFISRTQVPRSWPLSTGYQDCVTPDTLLLDPLVPPAAFEENYFGGQTIIPLISITGPGGGLLGYTISTVECLDCRRRGTDVRPPYWQ